MQSGPATPIRPKGSGSQSASDGGGYASPAYGVARRAWRDGGPPASLGEADFESSFEVVRVRVSHVDTACPVDRSQWSTKKQYRWLLTGLHQERQLNFIDFDDVVYTVQANHLTVIDNPDDMQQALLDSVEGHEHALEIQEHLHAVFRGGFVATVPASPALAPAAPGAASSAPNWQTIVNDLQSTSGEKDPLFEALNAHIGQGTCVAQLLAIGVDERVDLASRSVLAQRLDPAIADLIPGRGCGDFKPCGRPTDRQQALKVIEALGRTSNASHLYDALRRQRIILDGNNVGYTPRAIKPLAAYALVRADSKVRRGVATGLLLVVAGGILYFSVEVVPNIKAFADRVGPWSKVDAAIFGGFGAASVLSGVALETALAERFLLNLLLSALKPRGSHLGARAQARCCNWFVYYAGKVMTNPVTHVAAALFAAAMSCNVIEGGHKTDNQEIIKAGTATFWLAAALEYLTTTCVLPPLLAKVREQSPSNLVTGAAKTVVEYGRGFWNTVSSLCSYHRRTGHTFLPGAGL